MRWSPPRPRAWTRTPPAPSLARATPTLIGQALELAAGRFRAEPGNYWPAFQRLPDECVADIELLACAMPTPALTATPTAAPTSASTTSKMPPPAAPSWVPTTGNASRAPSIPPSPQPTPRPSYKPTGGAQTRSPPATPLSLAPSRTPTAQPTATPTPAPDARADSGARAGARRRGRHRAVFGTVVKPVAAAYDQSDPRARARAYINTVATAIVRTRAGADVRPDRSSSGVPTSPSASKPSARPTTALPTTWMPSAVPTSPPSEMPSSLPIPAPRPSRRRADVYGGPDAAGPLLRLRPDPGGPAPLLFDRGRHIRPEHRRDLRRRLCAVEGANLTVALSGDFNNGTEDGTREEAFFGGQRNSLATDRTVPTECLDSLAGRRCRLPSAGYETCAPFLDVPVTVQDGVLAATISAPASVDGCPAFATLH